MTFDEFVEELKKLDYDDSPAELLWEKDGFKIVDQEEAAWESRWGLGKVYVLEFPAEKPKLLPRYLQVSWEAGATEMQEDHPAGTEWVEVYPEEKTVTVYVTKKHDNSKIETTTIPLF